MSAAMKVNINKTLSTLGGKQKSYKWLQNKVTLSYWGGFKQKTLSHKTEALWELTINVKRTFNGGAQDFLNKTQNAPLTEVSIKTITKQNSPKNGGTEQGYETYRDK